MTTTAEEFQGEHGKLYQDQLYGAKVLSPLAVAVIDTPEFQRLAGLKQLGFADLVYRGAQHNRFSHSVGTYFLSRTIMRRIVQNHERLGLAHPGEYLPEAFCIYPPHAFPEGEFKGRKKLRVSTQSKWRGLTEIVSIAALLHDIGHVPFGHTLEDEFSGIYERHDRLGGPRLHELLFNNSSGIRSVFYDRTEAWIKRPDGTVGIPNKDLLCLIYLILSWKEQVDPPAGFTEVLVKELKSSGGDKARNSRLEELQTLYKRFAEGDEQLFQPFMSDVIGNTICADLLDYLPRDRMNLGMEYRTHARLQRYLTVRPGTLYENEGNRISIMVTRLHRGGQRPDVATAVLDIMRERYEMAERVYYHHKKAAVSSMLAKLAEIAPKAKLDDDAPIYPAPWTEDMPPSHMTHFSDQTFIDYMGRAEVDQKHKPLQRSLYLGLRFDRAAQYRTLLVVDSDIVQLSARPVSYYAKELRKDASGRPSSAGRLALEKELAEASGVNEGEVLIYCPSPDMQSKEVDARLEIVQDRVLPLRVQRESFAYHADLKVLEQYYQQLWLIYVFVSPRVYANKLQCKAIVDAFCRRYGVEEILAYKKVRRYRFTLDHDVVAERALEPLERFFRGDGEEGLEFSDTPSDMVAATIATASKDELYLQGVKDGVSASRLTERIAALFESELLAAHLASPAEGVDVEAVKLTLGALRTGNMTTMLQSRRAARGGGAIRSFAEYRKALLEFSARQGPVDNGKDERNGSA